MVRVSQQPHPPLFSRHLLSTNSSTPTLLLVDCQRSRPNMSRLRLAESCCGESALSLQMAPRPIAWRNLGGPLQVVRSGPWNSLRERYEKDSFDQISPNNG